MKAVGVGSVGMRCAVGRGRMRIEARLVERIARMIQPLSLQPILI